MLRQKKSFFKVCVTRTLFFIKKLFTKKSKQRYILLINYNNLGDLVCDTPSIRNIRKAFSLHKIILFVRNQQCKRFMELCPYIDKVIEMPHSKEPFKNYKQFAKLFLKYKFQFSVQFVRPFNEYLRTYLPYMMCIKKRYGLVQMGYEKIYNKAFNEKVFLDNTTTRTEESLLLVKKLGVNIDNDKTECWIDETQVENFDFNNFIVIQTCATLKSRMWHKNRFIELINLITKNFPKLKILLTGVVSEQGYINSIKEECLDKTNIFVLCDINISTLLSFIKNARVLITNDTGPFHFARAFNVPTIAIFGISPPEYLIKTNTNYCIALRGSSFCNKNCDIKLCEKECNSIYKNNIQEHHCINNVSVKEVYDNFVNLIKKD